MGKCENCIHHNFCIWEKELEEESNKHCTDFKNKRQVTYHPINETTKNKSNINGVEGMDFGEDVYIFLTKEEAMQALKGGVQE